MMGKKEGLINDTEFRERFISDYDEYYSPKYDLSTSYYPAGRFYHRIKLFPDKIDKENIKIMLFNDLMEDEAKFLSEVFEFLNVDSKFVPYMATKFNQGGILKSNLIGDIFTKTNLIIWAA